MALPVNGNTHLIPAYYSFYRPRKDERLSWPSWLTYSGWLTHISGHPSAAGRAQDTESSPARDRRSTTVPRHQLPKNRGFTIFHMEEKRPLKRNSSAVVSARGPKAASVATDKVQWPNFSTMHNSLLMCFSA